MKNYRAVSFVPFSMVAGQTFLWGTHNVEIREGRGNLESTRFASERYHRSTVRGVPSGQEGLPRGRGGWGGGPNFRNVGGSLRDEI